MQFTWCKGFTPLRISGLSPASRALRCRTRSCREVQDRDTGMHSDVTVRVVRSVAIAYPAMVNDARHSVFLDTAHIRRDSKGSAHLDIGRTRA